MSVSEIIDQTKDRETEKFPGLKAYFAFPFFPRRVYGQTDFPAWSKHIFWLVLPVHLTLLILLALLVDKPGYRYAWELRGFYLIGFMLGIASRTFFLAYILWISMQRVFRQQVPYSLCANIVLVTLLPLSFAAIIDAITGYHSQFTYWPGILYSGILAALAFAKNKQVDFSKMLAVLITAHFLLWAMLAPFMGMAF